jgi:hypothetical protein
MSSSYPLAATWTNQNLATDQIEGFETCEDLAQTSHGSLAATVTGQRLLIYESIL